MVFPNLHLVGAAKAGTTSLWAWLAQHPDIFAPRIKETHWAASDIGLQAESGLLTEAEYLAVYRDGCAAKYQLDASPSSLLSRVAARRIYEARADARVLIALRDPVEVIPSLHEQLALGGRQVSRRLSRALDYAETVRGRPLDDQGIDAWRQYLDVVDYAAQVARYREVFPANQVRIIWFDDIRLQPEATLASLLQWLGLDPVPIDPAPRNQARRVRSALIQRVLADRSIAPRIRGCLPPPLKRRARKAIGALNVVQRERRELSPALRGRIASLTRPSVDALENLLGVTLETWSRP
jgi:hypothetical protein